MIITKTPYRLSFFGGGTDYNSWFEKKGGLILGAGIGHYCYIMVRYLPQFFEHKTRIVYAKEENVLNNKKILHPSVRGCLEYLNINDGVEIHHHGDLPARSGIGSSSTFTVGLLNALYTLKQKIISPRKLAENAIKVEQEKLLESVGVQDQIIASHGGLRILELGPQSKWNIKNLLLSKEYEKDLENHVLLGFSGKSRTADIHAKQKIKNIEQGQTTENLLAIHSLAEEGLNAFKKEADFEKIGELLKKSWAHKKNLAKGVSSAWMDELYKTAIKNGAYGGKLMGAGGGGFFFFIAPPKKHQQIRDSLPQIKVWVPFKIDHSGSQIIFHNTSY